MSNGSSSWWAFDLGKRIWLGLELILWPLKFLALMMELVVGGVFIGAIGIVVAWWMHWIPEQVTVDFLNSLGARALGILQMQGVIHAAATQPSIAAAP